MNPSKTTLDGIEVGYVEELENTEGVCPACGAPAYLWGANGDEIFSPGYFLDEPWCSEKCDLT